MTPAVLLLSFAVIVLIIGVIIPAICRRVQWGAPHDSDCGVYRISDCDCSRQVSSHSDKWEMK